MRHIITLITLFCAFSLSAQITGEVDDVFVLGAQFGASTTLTDSTYQVSSTHLFSQLNNTFLPTGIAVGDILVDPNKRRFRVKVVVSTTFLTSTLQVVRLQALNLAPSGVGFIYRPTGTNDFIPREVAGIISPALEAMIDNHNAYNAANFVGGSGGVGDVTAAILNDSMQVVRDSLAAVRADISTGAGESTTVSDTPTIDLTLTGSDITGDVVAGSIGATQLASTGITPATYTNANVTFDADGRATAASNGTGGGVATVVAGTGISVNATDPANPVVTNTAPDQTVAITGAGSVAVTGTYPNFVATGSGVTGTGTTNTLPMFTAATTLGDSPVQFLTDRIKINADYFQVTGNTLENRAATANFGELFFNTTNYTLEMYTGTTWKPFLDYQGAAGKIPVWTDNNLGYSNNFHYNTSNGRFGVGFSSAAAYQVEFRNDLGVTLGEKGVFWVGRTDTSNPGLIAGYYANGSSVSFPIIRAGGSGNTGFALGGATSNYNIFISSTNKRTGFDNLAPNYKVDIGGTDAAIRLNPHNTTLTGAEGLLFANSVTKGLKGHDGTSFYRIPKFTDAAPANGQIPVFNSTSGMYTATTPAYLTAEVDGSVTNELPTYTSSGTGPVSPKEGDVWLNTTTNFRQVYLGGAYRNFLTGSANNGTISEVSLVDLNEAYFVDQDGDGAEYLITENAGTGNLEITAPGQITNPYIFSDTGAGANDVQRGSNITTALANRPIATTVTANRPAMWSGTGNELTAFPLESTLGLVRQTQTTAFELARGTTGEAPAATTAGRLRWNTTKVKPEISDGSAYRQLAYTNEYGLETFIINATSTIAPIKNIFVYTDAIVSSETVTIDVANLVGGTIMKVWAEGTIILDSSAGSFVASPGASGTATVTLTDQVAEYVWAFGSWFKTN